MLSLSFSETYLTSKNRHKEVDCKKENSPKVSNTLDGSQTFKVPVPSAVRQREINAISNILSSDASDQDFDVAENQKSPTQKYNEVRGKTAKMQAKNISKKKIEKPHFKYFRFKNTKVNLKHASPEQIALVREARMARNCHLIEA